MLDPTRKETRQQVGPIFYKLRSEAKLRAVFHASPDLMAIIRLADGKILEVNDGYSRMLGYSREESIGKTTAELAIWADLEDRKKFAAVVRSSGRIIDFETRLRRKNGSVITVIDSAQIMTIGGEACIFSIAHDITDRKKKEEAILRAKEDWERTFDSVSDLIAIIDNEYRIVRANKAMTARLGVSAEECVGLTCYDVVHSATEPPSFCPHKQLIEDGLGHAAEVHEDRLGGDFIVSVSPLIGPDGFNT